MDPKGSADPRRVSDPRQDEPVPQWAEWDESEADRDEDVPPAQPRESRGRRVRARPAGRGASAAAVVRHGGQSGGRGGDRAHGGAADGQPAGAGGGHARRAHHHLPAGRAAPGARRVQRRARRHRAALLAGQGQGGVAAAGQRVGRIGLQLDCRQATGLPADGTQPARVCAERPGQRRRQRHVRRDRRLRSGVAGHAGPAEALPGPQATVRTLPGLGTRRSALCRCSASAER